MWSQIIDWTETKYYTKADGVTHKYSETIKTGSWTENYRANYSFAPIGLVKGYYSLDNIDAFSNNETHVFFGVF